MDDADRAQLREEQEREAAIQAAMLIQGGIVIERDGKRWCADCGDAISDARLEAVPYAMRCVHCQQLSEGG